MKTRTTILLLLLVAGSGLFIGMWERRQPATREELVRQRKPFAFKPDDVDLVELISKDETLRLVRKDGLWRIGQPFDDRANPDLVKQLLEGLLALEWLETMERGELRKDDQKRTGLGDTAVEVTVRKDGVPLAQCRIGAAAALEDSVYVSLSDKTSELHLARTTLPALIRKPATDWRDPKLLRLKAEGILRFAITAGTGGMEFARSPGQPWQLVKPLQARASDDRVSAVLASFLNLPVKAARTATPVTTAGNSSLPVMTVSIGGDNPPVSVELTLHPNTDPTAEVQMESSDREGVFLAPAKVNDFWKLQPNHLRDQNLARIPAEAVTSLRIRSAAYAEVILDRQADTWMLSRFGRKETANQDRVRKLFDSLNTAQVREFLSDTATNLEPFGLHQPFLTVEWQAGGRTTALQFGQGAGGLVAARQTDEPFIYRISPTLLGTIPPDSLRWRGTKIVNASIFAVRRIIIAEGDRPSVTLVHNPDEASFTASIAGRDVTARLDKARANQLLQKLVNFEATDWSSDRIAGLNALKNPALTVQLLLTDPGNPKSETRPLTLTFAPTQPGMDTAIYHGRLDNEPDTFLISRDLYHELIAPLVQ